MTLKNKLLALLTAVILAVSLTGCDFLAADPQNRFFYTADGEHIYVMPHPESGLFSPLYTLDLPDVQAMATDPNGKFVYVAHTVSNEGSYFTMISSYSVDGNGHLAEVGESIDVGGEIIGMAVSPSGDSLIISGDIGFGTLAIDAVTGVPAFGDGYGFGTTVLQMAVHPGGTFVYGTRPDGYLVGYRTYDGEQVAEQYLSAPGSLVIDETGKYLVAFNAGAAPVAAKKFGIKSVIGGGETPRAVWYEINQSNGALTEVKSIDLPVGNGVAFSDARGRFVYLADTNNSQIQAFRLDAATQTLQPTATTPFDMAQLPIDFATLGVTKRAE